MERPYDKRGGAVAVPLGARARIILVAATLVQAFALCAGVAGLAPRDAQETRIQADEAARELAAQVTLSPDLPDDAQILGPDYAQLSDGTLVETATARPVTDPALTGTESTQPDPLALTGGVRREPVSAQAVRRAQAASAGSASDLGAGPAAADGAFAARAAADSASAPHQGNTFGAYWATEDGVDSIYGADGTKVIGDATLVIDVSQYQEAIDWDKVAASDVGGVIIRIGWGWGANQLDTQAAANVNACKERGIPFGVYLFSYANTEQKGGYEGAATVDFLSRLGIGPSDLSYPVYYDLEWWEPYSAGGATQSAPTDPATYEAIMRAYVAALSEAGFDDVSLYTNRSRLQVEMNSDYLHSLATWIAEYGAKLRYSGFGKSTSGRAIQGWQYSSTGSVSGITGRVDLNAFHVAAAEPEPTPTASASPTATAAPTTTSTATAATATPTASASPTATPTATPTASPTATASPSPTATSTATATPNPTGTATPTASPTVTGAASPSPTATPTADPTPSVTPTATADPTATPTADPTPSPTGAPGATPTATATPTPTATPTATATPSASPTPSPSGSQTRTQRMHRLYNPNSGEHFYTASISEHDDLVRDGWRDEGIGWTAPEESAAPVYRLYNPNAGDHHYTASLSERESLEETGWIYEGIGWYSAGEAEGVPVLRQYNPNATGAGAHNYTTSSDERDSLVRAGWIDEGIAWYAVRGAAGTA